MTSPTVSYSPGCFLTGAPL